MPTPEWRAEKSASLVKHLCDLLVRAKVRSGAAYPKAVPLTRADFELLLNEATKLYCDATEDQSPEREHTWSPELPEFLLNNPERCMETLGIVADEDYRDPYYDRPMDEGIIPDLCAPEGYILELHHADIAAVRSDSLRGLAVKLSELGLASEAYLAVRTSLLSMADLPDPGTTVEVCPEWQIRTVAAA